MKLKKIREKLSEASLDAVILTNTVSQRYISGFNFTDGYVVVGLSEAAILADFRYIEAARASSGGRFKVVLLSRENKNALADTLSSMGAKKVGFEDRFVTCAALETMKKKLDGFELLPVGSAVDDLREFKTAEEVECITKAQRIAEEALRGVLGIISDKMTEIELAAELEYRMRRAGSEEPAFQTIAISGAKTSLPHGEPSGKKLERGFITMDFGATVNGYRSDMTRTVVLGRADEEMKKLYGTVLAAQRAGLEAALEGADCAAVDKAARDIIDDAGYRGCFGHSLGHGVGMYIHEAPSLSPACPGKYLKKGHVVTVEPGIYVEGKYGCRIEDMVAITENGAVDITEIEKELIEL